MWVFGGYENASGACNDLYQFNVSSNVWSKIQVENRPSPRFAHSAFLIRDESTLIKKLVFTSKMITKLWLFLAGAVTLERLITKFTH
jgi:hypothetical protein